MTKSTDIVLHAIGVVSRAIGIVAIVGLMLHVVVDVVARFLLGFTLGGTVEYVTYWWMVPLALFGLVAAEAEGEHIEVPVLTDLMTDGQNDFLRALRTIATSVFLIATSYFAWHNATAQAAIREYGSASGVAIWPARFAVPVAAFLFFIAVLANARAPFNGEGEEVVVHEQG